MFGMAAPPVRGIWPAGVGGCCPAGEMNTEPVGGLCALKGFSFCRRPGTPAGFPAEPGAPFLAGNPAPFPAVFPGLDLPPPFCGDGLVPGRGVPGLFPPGRAPDAPVCAPNRLAFTRVARYCRNGRRRKRKIRYLNCSRRYSCWSRTARKRRTAR